MKLNIIYLLLMVLLGIIVSASIAQRNQNVPKTDTEVEKLKNRVSELEGKLQTVENIEKMELAAKLAEAQAKLNKTDIDKLKGELRESNNDWLRAWNNWFISIVSVIALIIGTALWLVLKTLIETGIKKRLDGFKESVDKISKLEGQLEALKKELAVSVLDNFTQHLPVELEMHNEAIKALSDEMLLEIFTDKTSNLEIKWKAVDVLVARNSTQLISPVITSLNNIADSDIEKITFGERFRLPSEFWGKLNGINNKETYQELKNFLNLLITDNPKNKDIFLNWTVILLVQVSSELDRSDSVSMIIETIPDLDNYSFEENDLKSLVEYFNKFQEHEGIKEFYNAHIKGKFPELEEKCLDLLEEKFSDFVKEQREEKASTDNESEGN